MQDNTSIAGGSDADGSTDLVLVIGAVLVGSAAMVGYEWFAAELFGWSTVPEFRQQRLLIVSQLGLWVALCGAAILIGLRNRRMVARAFGFRGERGRLLASFAWLIGAGAGVSLADYPAAPWAAPFALGAYLLCRRQSGRIRRLAVSATAPVAAFVLCLAGMAHDSALATSTAPTLAVACGLAWAGRRLALVQRSRILAALIAWSGLLVFVAVVCSAAGNYAFPALLLGFVCCLGGISSASDDTHATDVAWGAAIVIVVVVGLRPMPAHASVLFGFLVAGVAVALLTLAVWNAQGAGRPIATTLGERRATVVGLLAVVATAVLLTVGSTLVVVALAAGLAAWRLRLPSDSGSDQVANRPESDRWRARLVAGFVVAAILVRLVFWVVTDRVWEDALITIRHAENAVGGHGLTHHPAHGNVHGFTSPLGVLIPLVGEFAVPGGAMTALRLASLIAAGLTVGFAAKLADHPDVALSTPALTFWLGYLAIAHSQIAFGMGGMETQLWTCVLIGGACALAYGRVGWLAVALAAAALCRPDAVLWIALCLLGLLRLGIGAALRTGLLALAGATPWLLFTFWHYGSPTPNPVIAKSVVYFYDATVVRRFDSILSYSAAELRFGMWRFEDHVTPNYCGHGLAPTPTTPFPKILQRLLAALAVLGGAMLIRARTWPIPVFVIGFIGYLLLIVRLIYSWYPVAVLGLGGLLIAVGIDACCRLWRPLGQPVVRWSLSITLFLAYLLPLPWTFASERQVQMLIEDGVRKRVGLWLREHAQPSDYVCAECLGYFGYHSNLPFHDFPGLSSPRAVAAIRSGSEPTGSFVAPILQQLQPEWLILRSDEMDAAPDDYEEVQVIRLPAADAEALNAYLDFPTIDHEFHILRRKPRAVDRK